MRATTFLLISLGSPVISLAPVTALLLPLVGWCETAGRVAILAPRRIGLSGGGSPLREHAGMAALIGGRARAVQMVWLHHGLHHA